MTAGLRLFLCCGLLLAGITPAKALDIVVTNGASLNDTAIISAANATAARAAFDYVAAHFEAIYSDPVTIRITLEAAPGTNILGQSAFSYGSFSYASVRNALSARATTPDDASAVASLPATAPAGAALIRVPKSLTKVLGLLDDDGTSDGTFTFGAGNSYSFDPANRAVAGKFDFIGVAYHEISELMGRVGGVSSGIEPFVVDLYRYSGPGARVFAQTNGVYFSIDGGTTLLKQFNSVAGGDIQDWQTASPTDACDAFSGPGTLNALSAVDLRVIDVIGFTRRWTVSPWTDDASTGVLPVADTSANHVWAYHFGYPSSLTVNGRAMVGVEGPTYSDSNIDLVEGSIFASSTNQLTALTGTASAQIGCYFLYGHTAPSLTLKGLTVGKTYRLSVLGVGFGGIGGRYANFTDGPDVFAVDEDMYGDQHGIRLDYDFTATASTRTLTFPAQNQANTWHLHAASLKELRPKIRVYSEPAYPLANHDLTPDTTDGTDFGSSSTDYTIPHTFTIANDGTQPLNVSSTSIGASADFFIDNISPVIQPGTSATFGVSFHPTQSGLRGPVNVTISSNDPGGSFQFAVQGTGLSPAAPTVLAANAAPITATGATLNAWVTPNGRATTVYFWISGPGFSDLLPATVPIPFNDFNQAYITLPVTSLQLHGTYQYQAIASNNLGQTSGAFTSFITNTRPVATAQSGLTTNEDTAKIITLAGTDADGDTLTYSINANPSHGSVALTGNTATYTPTANYSGTDAFTFRVSDDYGGTSNSATVSLTVTAVNDAPTLNAIADQAITESSGLQTIALAGIAAGGGETQTITITAASSNTALIPTPTVTYTSPAATGSLSYTPVPTANGSAVITVTVLDNGGTTNGGVNTTVRTFTVTVNGVNNAPSFALPATQSPAGITWTARDGNRSWRAITSSADGTKLAAVVNGGQIYTSIDSGVTWTARSSSRSWTSICSSADGTKLAAAVNNGLIYTSIDSGVNWTGRDSSRVWYSITSSSDGTKLAAVENAGQIYTSTNAGVSWTARDSTRSWQSITSSTDGTKLAAVVSSGQIYTSTDSGVTWTARASSRTWSSIASSSDGTKLAAVVSSGQIYTSADLGVTWTARDSVRSWSSITSSADGTKLAAVVSSGQIYTSTDSGVTWTAREISRAWTAITSSADGAKLAAVVSGGQIYTSLGAPYALSVTANSGPNSIASFATNISPGPANEASQTVSFSVTNSNNALFSTQPAIAPDGTLTFTPNSANLGTATVTVVAQDNGGTASGGVDTSVVQTFTITTTAPPPPTVPGAPTIGTATGGNGSASVAFTAPASNGGSAITSYTATSSPGGFTGTGSASPITVSGLTNGTAYTFTVTATNAVGTGSASAASNSVTPVGAPGAPTIGTATGGNGSASVAFTAPASNGGSAITSYTVTSSPGGFTGTGSASPITVNGLTNGTAYTFTVTATNAVGTGSASAASNSVTPATVPGAPIIGTATGGNGSASVAFTPPASNGGAAITSYTATSSPGGFTGTGSVSPITVSGLTNGTAYTFTVTATNAAGTGSASAASNSVTPVPLAGTLDNTFSTVLGGGGMLAMAVQPDGKTIIGGSFTTVGGATHTNLARLNADGSVDATFTASTNSQVYCIAVQADGKIVLGGGFTSVNGQTRNAIARLNGDGSLESTTTFNAGTGANAVITCLAVQPDGKILLGGNFTTVNSAARGRIARLNGDGTLESTATFNPGTGVNDNTVFSVAVQADGKILLGGNFTTVNGQTRNSIARLNGDGTLESTSTFNPDTGANAHVLCMGVQGDGKIVLGGLFTSINGVAINRIARLNGDGSVESTATFNPGTGANAEVSTMTVQADGKILIGGFFTSVNGVAINRIARLNGDGSLESTATFNPGTGANDVVFCVAMQADGKIVLGGNFTTVNGTARNAIARLNNDATTQSLTAVNNTQVLWSRVGAGPEVSQMTFERSADGGSTWTMLGSGTRVGTSANWQLTGLSLPTSGHLRARGRTAGGYLSGSSGLIEQVAAFTAAPPEIAVTGNSVDIVDDDAVPSLADFTDFGSTTTTAGTALRTFTITNSGLGALTLGTVTIGGTHAADFSVTTPPASTVAPASSTMFQLTFDPSATGLRNATLSFTNNDADENPFNFSIQGTGTNTAPTDIVLTSSTIAENNAANATVGTLSSIDADTADVPSFSLVSGTGSTDNGSFSIAGTALKITPGTDFETKSSYAIRVAVNDGQGGISVKALVITVTDVNEAPAFTVGASQSISSTTSLQTVSGFISSFDDGDSTVTQSLTFGITGNTNTSLFTTGPTISSTGTLLYTPSGTAGTATISVTLTDDASINGTPALTTAAQTFTITVTQTVAQTWAQANGVSSNLSLNGANDLPNLLNFAFAMSPTASSRPLLSYTGNFSTVGSVVPAGEPIVGIQDTGATRLPWALYTRRKDYLAAGLTYTVRFSNDLSFWQNSVAVPIVLADDGVNQLVGVPFLILLSNGQTPRFFEISVSIAP